MKNNGLAAIIVGGGSSSRMRGSDKLYAPLGGRPVIAATVEVFETAREVETIALVVAAERVNLCRDLARERGWRKVGAICAGGASRSLSVANGLKALAGIPASFIAVHDAARPFVTPELIARGLAAAQRYGAAVPGMPCADTMRRVDATGRALETLPRSDLRAIQTPQVFARALLEQAYQQQAAQLAGLTDSAAITDDAGFTDDFGFTDDAAVVEACGVPVHVFAGDYGNMKITTPEDLVFSQWRAQNVAGLMRGERSDGGD